ncbi:ABC transporter permease [Helicobacter burdigaliensis]|uniref:capsule polysaccharide transporter KpsM n=1 Tax=Helicobacter burdigaliensis TaxID=2315334 RepID=UPI000EF7173E|nr:ABC transporter permease [Helicobacter burdigaliensis]
MTHIISALFLRELKTRFGKNKRLGYFWVIGEPMSIVLTITAIATAIREYHHQVMPSGISIFMFLVVGIVPYFMFRSIVSQLINGIEANLLLFAYKPVKPIHVFIARTCLEFCIYFTIFVSVLILAGWFLHLDVIPDYFLNVMLSFALLIGFGFVIGIGFALIGFFFEPLKTLLNYFLIVFYWASGVIFPTWLMPRPILDVLYYNPMLHVMELLRSNFFSNYPLQDDYNYIYPLACIMVLLFISLGAYYHNRQALIAAKKR